MSVIKVNKIESTGTTAGGVEVDSSGHVQVDGVQMPTAGALSNRNLIINGAMNVAQRGTSSTTNGYGTVDRFKPGFTGGAQTQTQETLTSGSPYNEGFRKFLRLTNTTASTGTGDLRRISYLMEGQDIVGSGWNYTSSSSYITLSFWARASVSQTYYVEVISNDGTAQNYTFAVSLTANTWTKIEKTIPGNSSITFDNDTGAALQIDFIPFYGTDFTDSGFTTDVWAAFSGSSRAPDFTNTWANTTNATFDLTGVQLEVGEKATANSHSSYGDELQRCLRYFYRAEWAYLNKVSGLNYRFIPPGPATVMRTAPAHSFFNPDTGTANQVREHSSGTARAVNDNNNAGSAAQGPTTYIGTSTSSTYAVQSTIHYDAEL